MLSLKEGLSIKIGRFFSEIRHARSIFSAEGSLGNWRGRRRTQAQSLSNTCFFPASTPFICICICFCMCDCIFRRANPVTLQHRFFFFVLPYLFYLLSYLYLYLHLHLHLYFAEEANLVTLQHLFFSCVRTFYYLSHLILNVFRISCNFF